MLVPNPEISPLRRLALRIQKYTLSLKSLSGSDPDLVRAHDALCEVLDAFNSRLSREKEGALTKVWEQINSSQSHK